MENALYYKGEVVDKLPAWKLACFVMFARLTVPSFHTLEEMCQSASFLIS